MCSLKEAKAAAVQVVEVAVTGFLILMGSMWLVPVGLGLVVSRCVGVVVNIVVGIVVHVVMVIVVGGGMCNMGLGVVRGNSMHGLMVVIMMDERDILVGNGSVVVSDGLAVRDTLVVYGLDVVDNVVGSNGLVVNWVLMRAEVITAVSRVVGTLVVSVAGGVVGVVRLILQIVVSLVAEVIVIIVATIAVVAMGIGIAGMRPTAINGHIVVVVSVVLLVARSLVDTVGVSRPIIISVVSVVAIVRVGRVAISVVGTVVVITSVPGIGMTVAVANTVTISVAVSMAVSVTRAVAITVRITVTIGVTVALSVAIVVSIAIDVTLMVDRRVADGLVDGVVVVVHNGDMGHRIMGIRSVKRSVGHLVAHDGLVPTSCGSDLSVVVRVEVDGGVSVVGSVVTARLPVLLRDVSNGVAVEGSDITVSGVLSPSVLRKNMTFGMAEAVSVVANTVAVVTTVALEGVVVAEAVAVVVAIITVSDVPDASVVLVRSTNSFTEIVVSAGAAKVLGSGHRVMGTMVEIGTVVLMNWAVVVALEVARDVLLVGLDVETAVVSLVPVLAVLPGGSNGSNHADSEGLHVRVDG